MTTGLTLDELIRVIAKFFADRKIAYFAVGGIGVSLWGEPRTTKDLDVLVCLDRKAVSLLVADLNRLGFKITTSLHRKFMEGRMIKLPIGLTELDVKLCRGEHDMEALRRTRTAQFADFTLSVASSEDIILYKLEMWRPQDKADIHNLFKNVKDLDIGYIEAHLALVEDETGYPVRERWLEVSRNR